MSPPVGSGTTVIVCVSVGPNQVTPSCTIPQCVAYVPGVVGAMRLKSNRTGRPRNAPPYAEISFKLSSMKSRQLVALMNRVSAG